MSKPFAKAGELAKVYSAKMGLIAGTVRLLIVVHGATGPAVNPALATSYALVSSGYLPGLSSTHYTTYWLGGIAGGVAMGIVWRLLQYLDAPNATNLFPNEIFKIVVGIYLAVFGTVLWAAYYRPQTDAIIAGILEGEHQQKLRDRNVWQKVLRRKPTAL